MDRLLNSMITHGIIESSDKAIYDYGLRQGMVILTNLFATAVIGVLMGMVWQTLLFMIAYIPLRTYTGGYHAKTQRTCFFLSISMITLSLVAMKYLQPGNSALVSIALVVGIVILKFAPMADNNKPLSKDEIKIYGRKAKTLYTIELLMLIATIFLKFPSTALCLTISLFWVGGLVAVSVFGSMKCGNSLALDAIES